MNIKNVIDHFGTIECRFVFFDGNSMSFDFIGVDENENTVRISIGGCPEYIRHLEFSSDDPINIPQALERHVRYLSVTNSRGTVLYEQFFELPASSKK